MPSTLCLPATESVDAFANVFGAVRGHAGVGDAKDPMQAFLRDVEYLGLREAVALLSHHEQRLTGDLTAVTEHASRELLKDDYKNAESLLARWMRWGTATRPDWMLHFASNNWTIHYLPNGHLAGSTSDLWQKMHEGKITTACGTEDKSQGFTLLTRGGYYKSEHSSNPAGHDICQACAKASGDHYEKRTDDNRYLLPDPVWMTDMKTLYKRRIAEMTEGLTCGKSVEDISLVNTAAIENLCITWSAQQYATNPDGSAQRVFADKSDQDYYFNIGERVARHGHGHDFWLAEITANWEQVKATDKFTPYVVRKRWQDRLEDIASAPIG